MGYSSVRGYALSLDAQDGILTSARLQGRRYVADLPGVPAGRNYWRATTRNHAFTGFDHFGFAPSVLALRMTGGVESGSAAPGFRMGGAGGSTLPLPIEIAALGGGSSAYPLRGYPPATQIGTRVVNASLEYRFPIRFVERGVGLLPLGLSRLWGDVFADAGAAWCPEPCRGSLASAPRSPDPLLSVGAEAILDLRLLYFVSLPLRVGFGVPLVGEEMGRARGYVRVGPGF
jgi:outer membrane protein assembly factor BamA